MIDHGLQLPSMLELVKKALVEEAAGVLAAEDRGGSDSRIALLTGVHRKDVRRLREALVEQAVTTPMASVTASVVARWISEPRFLNADQSPRRLARTPGRAAPGQPDFASLVAEVSSDVGARAVLDELERLGVVELLADGRVALKANAFVPREGLSESFGFLAANVSAHLATAAHNLDPQRTGDPQLEQSAFSQGLSAEQAGQLHAMARRLWVDALRQFLQTATVAEQRSEGAAGPRHRVRFGVYFNDTVQPAQPAAAAEAAASKARPGPSRKRSKK